jgi:hypothetical protein
LKGSLANRFKVISVKRGDFWFKKNTLWENPKGIGKNRGKIKIIA